MTRVLLASTDVVGRAMAGPGIRAWELAHALAGHGHQVTLAVPGSSDLTPGAGVALAAYAPGQPGALGPLLAQAEVLVGQGFVFAAQPELLASALPLAIDLYDPLIMESLDLYAHADLAAAQAQHARYQALTEAQLARGDFFFCATERQRDYWLGALTAAGRITPSLARAVDRALHGLIACVPSGIATAPPACTAPVLRGVHPAIPADALLVVWAGGLWEWFDPATIIRAVAALAADHPRLRLVFFAGARPNPDGPPIRTPTAAQARALAAELGLLDNVIVFLEEWVPYAQRGAYLAEADIGVSAHRPGVETRLAFRTRLLDYLWARLPIVCTTGDSLGAELAAAGAGLLVPPGDVAGWQAALAHLAADKRARAACRAQAAALAPRYVWAAVARPLAAFCAAPQRTAATAAPAAQADVHQLRALVAAYERGRFVRLMRWLHGLRRGGRL